MPIFSDSDCTVIRCDECGEPFTGIMRTPDQTMDAARAKGWDARKVDDEYRYFCSFCVDFKVGA